MTISSRFSVAIHILSLLEINKDGVSTSEYISGSVNTNPVVIRRIMSMLNKAGLVEVRPGVAGTKLSRKLCDITLLDIYRAVHVVEEDGLFAVHDHPNPDCPVGRNIQSAIEPIFSMAQKALEKTLEAVTLQDIVEDISAKTPVV
ncbi:Rrf2 family transcriptional regulator [Paenibacillus macerans]|uniref:Transcriptional regulator n=1 Tax=Paenibacillus macerans TaxID=44252 RepID=A0A090ZBU8_PAEMA|nr:Rrf2 family transcriptional regulator [Paenibacillus macerans]KFN08769.1 transcriptional regulator family protein [Paenibacillus macerans]MBS5914537.1 Rrf2 family transcriptional regulator [Paenibacillus macerans]MCY7560102.1 Rrf2 family transcriptional regulator [Paenibacillus macerans]MDU5949602.1 Rrf2 family transcriptional regulator [Paenibacillus macerans]MDU7475351.1 Rrf2 family transcriptional regulator [Paenibacillus macerans]